MMEYKGYVARIDYDEDAEIFHAEVVNTRDVITFQGESVAALKQALRDSVDDYLEWCAERGEDPDKPYSGRFVVRVPPDVHRDLALEAHRRHVSLNKLVAQRLREEVCGR